MSKYRFQHGSLYEWSLLARAYVHCYTSASANTKRKAIAEYEQGSCLIRTSGGVLR